MKYQGGCHCGLVRFSVEGEIAGVISCNCSICQRKGSLMWFVPRENLQLLTPEADAGTYSFNKHLIHHRFCQVCGMHPYGEGTDPKGRAMAAVNIRCLEDIELEGLPVKPFNGRAL